MSSSLDTDGHLNTNERDRLIKKYLSPMQGGTIKLQNHKEKLFAVRSPKTIENDEVIVRKLKAANYGKWFIRPDDFNRRIE